MTEEGSLSTGGDTPGSQDNNATASGDKTHRVYVGNLAWKVGWQDLKDHMRSAGGNVVRADVFLDNSGRSRGCGVVEFETAEQAQDAIDKLTDTELKDRKIFVREDREEEIRLKRGEGGERGRGGGGGFRGGYRGGRHSYGRGGYSDYRSGNRSEYASYPRNARPISEHSRDCQIFVGNLAWKTSWQDLKDLFREAGDVIRAEVYQRDGVSRGCGTVLFHSPEEAAVAVEKFNDFELDGRQISVRLDQGPPGRGGGGQYQY